MALVGLHDLCKGMAAYPRAVALLLRRPRLLLYAIAPILLTVLLVAGLGFGAVYLLSDWISGWVGPAESAWKGALYYAIMLVVACGALALGCFAFMVMGAVLAAPFNDPLSARAEGAYRSLFGPDEIAVVSGSAAGEGTARSVLRGVLDTGRLMGVMVSAQLAVLPLLLVPVAGAAISLGVLSYFNGVDFLDLVLSRHGFTYAEKKAIVRANRPRVLGLGIGVTLCMFIPFTTLLVLPVGAVGGTLVYLDLAKEGKLTRAETPTEAQSSKLKV